jgi:hypothetical protein
MARARTKRRRSPSQPPEPEPRYREDCQPRVQHPEEHSRDEKREGERTTRPRPEGSGGRSHLSAIVRRHVAARNAGRPAPMCGPRSGGMRPLGVPTP